MSSLALLAALSVMAESPSAIYGNIQFGHETGDLGGMQIQLFDKSTPPFAKVLICEGECRCWHSAPLKRVGEHITFDIIETLADGCRTTDHWTARVSGSTLAVSIPGTYWGSAKLKRQKRIFGPELPACR